MARSLSDLSGDIDALYHLPLAEFTPARNTLEKRVRGEQGKEAAAAIKALEKPSVSAWVVNQLYWRHRGAFDRLISAGDDLRTTQQKRLAGRDADVNAAIDARREALSALMAIATTLLRENGTTSPDIRQRVETTLEALSVYGRSDAAPRVGRLVDDVQPPGFAALAALVPAGPGPGVGARAKAPAAKATAEAKEDGESIPAARPRAVPTSPARAADARRLEKARAALEEAESAVIDARATAERAAASQTTTQKEWDAAREAVEKLQQKLNDALDRERAAQVQRDAERKAATQAAHALDRAERARNEAERYLQSLTRG